MAAKVVEKPEILKEAEALVNSGGRLIEFMALFGIDAFMSSRYRWDTDAFYLRGDTMIKSDAVPINPLTFGYLGYMGYSETLTINTPMVYVAKDGTSWTSKINISVTDCKTPVGMPYGVQEGTVSKYTVTKWEPAKKLKLSDIQHVINGDMDAMLNEYSLKFLNEYFEQHDVEVKKPYYTMLYIAPQIEQLCKAGYEIGPKILDHCHNTWSLCGESNQDFTAFERTVKKGNNLKEIFAMPKVAYTALKEEGNIKIWDSFRKMVRTGKLSPDEVKIIYERGYDERDLRQCNEILTKKFDGKPIFTWKTLSAYLDRIDMHEAIGQAEGCQLLSDYLRMCIQAGMKPKIDSDFLKREHDVMARLFWQTQNERDRKALEGACEYLKVNDYEENNFFIRGIRDYDDLISEASQQRNCVASYAESIANKRAWIYVMREKAHPDKSLVTVQLSSDGRSICQKYLAYNRPVRSKAQNDFLKRWLAWIAAGRPEKEAEKA